MTLEGERRADAPPFFYFGCVCSLILIAVMSVSIAAKTAANFGLEFCIRLLDASAMLRASIMISISAWLSLNI